MKGYLIVTGTVTLAIKGKELLKSRGIAARVEKVTSQTGETGCGYAIFVAFDKDRALKILKGAGIRILQIIERA